MFDCEHIENQCNIQCLEIHRPQLGFLIKSEKIQHGLNAHNDVFIYLTFDHNCAFSNAIYNGVVYYS